MQINPNLPVDPGAAGLVRQRPSATPSAPPPPSSQYIASDFDLNRLQTLRGDTSVPDESGANQALGFLQSNILSQPGSALAAQANLNPESAYALLV